MTKQKSTKRALLMSALSLLMCVSMLIGSTFAWFTDSVTSGNNKIVAGNLDVALYHTNGTDTDEEVTDTTKLFDEVALWEPGAMVWEKLTVRNLGSLALKYTLSVNVSDVSVVNGKSLADVLKVAVMTEQPTRDNIKTATTQDLETFALKGEGVLGAKTGVDTFYVAIYWAPTADDNDYNIAGEQLYATLGVNLLATQATVEKDSFNNQYDANAKYDVDIWDGKTVTAPEADADGVYHITSAADLVGMMNVTGNSIYKGKTIVLDNNIDLGGRTVKGIGGISDNFAGVFDGQGYTISNFKVDSTENSYYAGLFNQVSHGGTIKNLTVKNATIVGNSMVGAVASSLDNAVIDNCKAIDCTLIGVKKVGSVVGYTAGGTVKDCYAENCTVLYSEKDGGEILGYQSTDSTVSNNTANNVSVNQGVAVSSADELVYFADSVNSGKKTYAGETVMLTADIDLAGKLWIPVGQTQVSSFQGTFDGQGHTIKNMTVNYTGTNSNYACGLFGWIELHNGAPIVIQNVKFDNANVTGIKYTGVVAGYANGASGAEIKNCVVTNSTVTSNSKNAGGIIGYMGKGVLTGNTVSGCTISAKCDVGGIANSVEPAVTFTKNKVENTKIYYEEDQSYDAAGIFTGGKVVYRDDNNKTTFVPDSTNTNSNVTVNKLVAVSTAEELSAALKKTYTEDTTVMLTKDITLTGEWVEHSLDGRNNANLTINGNGNTIYGLTSTNYYSGNGFNSNGLVTHIKSGLSSVTFKNLTIDGANLTNNGGDSAATGVFVGDINTVNVTFDTCTVKGANVNCYKWAGGFIGYIQDVYGNKSIKLINCVVSDSNINTTDSSVGGLVGQHYTNLTITGCKIMGKTTIKCDESRNGKEAKAGYLLGTATVKTTTISNITVESTVSLDTMGGTTYDTTNYVGRIAGGATVNGVTPNF